MSILLLTLIACAVSLSFGQPLCRDLKAPFQYNQASYCPEYAGFGCCGKRDERQANKWADYAQLKLTTAEERAICSGYSRNISCLTCSPLAGRIFDTINEHIPLCLDYCVEVYIKCRFSLLRMFKLHPWRQGLVSKFPNTNQELERDSVVFCTEYASESPYCYPDVVALELEYMEPLEQTDCVCAIPVLSGLRQPLAIVGANDKSDRLFILEQPGVVRILDEQRIGPKGLKSNVLIEEPFLNMTSQLMATSDDGLMNMAFHPQYSINGRVYVYYHHLLQQNVSGSGVDLFSMNISEFRVAKDNSNQVDYDTQRLVFSVTYDKYENRAFPELIGGAFFFKDGYLFLGIGENEDAEGDVQEAQNL